jgi:Fe-S cluster assembly protein SufD
MSTRKSTIVDVFTRQFADLEKQLNGTAKSPAHLARKTAFDHFKALGLPGRKDEEYRYTPIARQLEQAFAGFKANPQVTTADIGKNLLPDLNGYNIVFVNGNFSEELSQIEAKTGIDVQIVSKQQDLIASSTLDKAPNDVFSDLNLALAASGVIIRVEKNVVIEVPINIIHLVQSDQGRVLTTPRHRVAIGENARATISEIFIGTGKHSSFTNSGMEVTIDKNGLLNHYKVGLDGEKDLRIDNSTFHQQNNSVLHTVNLNFGGKVIRNNLNIVLDGEYCESNLDGLYMPVTEGNIDNHTVVDHRVPNCNSNELYKGIMEANSTGVFNGKVFVQPDAQKTNAFQSNKNILLTDTATVNTKPQLEIWADDVKCSHGCTVGQMDKEQLFYLRARGIDEAIARKLLLKAFAEEIIEKIKDEKLKNTVEAILEEKLNN